MKMFPFEFVILIAGLGFISMGFYFKDYALSAFGSMLIIIFGVYVSTVGLLGFSNFLVQSFGVVCIGVGAYVFIRGGVELIKGGD